MTEARNGFRVWRLGLARARARAGTLNRCTSGQALRDDAHFLLQLILAWFRPGSRSLKQLQVTSCKLNKKRLSVIGSAFSEKRISCKFHDASCKL
ncbi:hypothetical protein V511_10195 [Mesotoga sp. Brook.08.YT.4.2.5.1]|nr:hypothetical protein V511_10195 [Mesotoga sp. Brook.08.YT.4.2.5.1]